MRTLTEIGRHYGTDKAGTHNFTDLYIQYFEKIRLNPVKILELGVYLGASIKMWREYFPYGTVYGIDIDDTCKRFEEERIKIFKADQKDREQLKKFINMYGNGFDIIIDDALHFQDAQQISWGFLFPYVKSGGIYVIEDLKDPVDPGWGQLDFVNYSDCTYTILQNYQKEGVVVSPHMSKDEMEYINRTIDKVTTFFLSKISIISFINKK